MDDPEYLAFFLDQKKEFLAQKNLPRYDSLRMIGHSLVINLSFYFHKNDQDAQAQSFGRVFLDSIAQAPNIFHR